VKILHLTNVDAAGGTNTNCLQFIQASAADNSLVVLDEPGEMQVRWLRARIKVTYLRILRGRRAAFARVLAGTVADVRPDVVVLWGCIRVPLIRYAIRESGVVLGIHLGNPNRGDWWSDGLLHAQGSILPSNVRTRLFSCSEYVRSSFSAGYWKRFENRVIYNPIEVPTDLPAADWHHPDAPPCLGMVARLDCIKDHATLLRAVGLLRDQGAGVTLELVGDGPERVASEKLVAQLDLGSAVRFLGYRPDVLSCLSRWVLFVYSTTANEGLGNSVIEALAAGVPCVVSDLPMMREIDAGRGLMSFFRAGDPVDCAEKILAALRDRELRERVSLAGRRHVEKRYAPERYCMQLTEYLLAP